MAYELVMKLGQPFAVLIGKKWVMLPLDGEIRVQFTDREAAQTAYVYLASHSEVRQCRDESESTAKVVAGEVVRDADDQQHRDADVRAVQAQVVHRVLPGLSAGRGEGGQQP